MGLLEWLQDPRRTQAMQGIGSAIQSGLLGIQQGHQRFQDLQKQAFADPTNPARVTNPQAMNELAQMGMGLLSFAPVGMTTPYLNKDEIRSSADFLANQLTNLGFTAKVNHSGSKAGASSYVEIYDPQTGRFFDKPIRFSGHGKGPKEASGVIDIQNIAEDIPKVLEIANNMRMQGPSKQFQIEEKANELIANGVKPKSAYKQAKEYVEIQPSQQAGGLLETAQPKFNVTSADASDIFGAGAKRVRYQDPASNGFIDVLQKPDGTASVLGLEVPEVSRGKGIGQSLQQQVLQDFPEMQGQVSSKAAAKTAYRLGRRPPGQPEATLDDVYRLMDENSSVNLVSPEMQKRFLGLLE